MTPEVEPQGPENVEALGLADLPAHPRPDAGARQARVQHIDFRRPTKFARDVVRRLEHAHDAFCRTASSGLSAGLRTSFELSVGGSEQLPYGTAMAEASPEALLVVLTVSPLDTEIALTIEIPLALKLIDRLLGGGSKQFNQTSAGLTDLEIVIVRRAIESIIEPLSATWLDLVDVSLSISSIQTSPMTFQLVSPSEPVLIMVLDARIDGTVSPLSLCIPYRSVETVIERFEHRHRGPDAVDPETSARMHAAISRVAVDVRVEAGAVKMPVEEVLALSVGDVVRLGRKAEDGVVIHAGDVPTFVARPGRNGRARAVQIVGPCEVPE